MKLQPKVKLIIVCNFKAAESIPIYSFSASAEQKSLPIYLEKRNLYELVATLKEKGGRDYITVAVELPSGEFLAPIPAERLFIGKLFHIYIRHMLL
jgi:hypothetical protein